MQSNAKTTPAQGKPFIAIRRQLLMANLIVLTGVLVGFAIAVRIVFIYSLRQQQQQQLTTLAQTAAALVESEVGDIEIEIDMLPISDLNQQQQGIQWFNRQGQLVQSVGVPQATTPVTANGLAVTHTLEQTPTRLRTVTVPITLESQLWGYVRTSQTLVAFDRTTTLLDLGLSLGVIIALGLSGAGALWLSQQAMAPIAASFYRLQQFTADASHELRSPLMAITSNAEVALKYAVGMRPDDRDTFDLILNAAEQMSQLTNNLLILARSDRLDDLAVAKVDLSTLLNTLTTLYQPEAQQQGLTFTTQISPHLSCQGNGSLLQQALTNLIQNAIRYTPSPGTITLQAQQHGNTLHITVTDTGIGIASDQLEVIFERFWRADQARHHAAGGSGLGLAITQAIVHRHGGTIQVASQVSQGSCFTVTLPQ